jgi:DnaK suppressor protein
MTLGGGRFNSWTGWVDSGGCGAYNSGPFSNWNHAPGLSGVGVVIVNKTDLKRFKKMLEESKKELLKSAKKTLMEESNFDTDDLPDEIDLASSEYTQSMVFRLRDREKFLLKKIDKALARIEEGSFGVCERCDEEISLKRLEARPVTTLCIRCKEEQEKKEKSYG